MRLARLALPCFLMLSLFVVSGGCSLRGGAFKQMPGSPTPVAAGLSPTPTQPLPPTETPIPIARTLVPSPSGSVRTPVSRRPFVYVASVIQDGVVTAIEVNTGVTTTIAVGPLPKAMTLSPDYRTLFVVDAEGVSLIDTDRNVMVERIPVGSGWGAAVDSSGRYLYTAARSKGKMLIVDIAGRRIAAEVPVGVGAPKRVGSWYVEVLSDGSKAYVVNHGETTVSIVDLLERVVIKNVSMMKDPTRRRDDLLHTLALSLDESKVYVPQPSDRRIWVIDTGSDEATVFPLEEKPYWVGNNERATAISPDGRHLWFTTLGAYMGGVSVLSLQDFREVARIPARGYFDITFSPDGRYAYATNGYENTVEVIDTETYTVVERIGVGENPHAIIYKP